MTEAGKYLDAEGKALMPNGPIVWMWLLQKVTTAVHRMEQEGIHLEVKVRKVA